MSFGIMQQLRFEHLKHVTHSLHLFGDGNRPIALFVVCAVVSVLKGFSPAFFYVCFSSSFNLEKCMMFHNVYAGLHDVIAGPQI